MVTGRDVMDRALVLLNYTNRFGEVDGQQSGELYKRGLAILNQVYSDLWHIEHSETHPKRGEKPKPLCWKELCNMAEPIRLSPRTVQEVMPYGVAMFLAQSESDSDNQSLMAALYNQKRMSVPHGPNWRLDVLPRGIDG